MTAALERIAKQTTAILVAPTFGTITGSEKAMLEKLEENKGKGFLENLKTVFLKKVVKIVSSRRPIDRDMYYESDFVNETKRMFYKLKDHNITNIVDRCPEKSTKQSIKNKIFIDVGKRLGLNPEESDGIVETANQEITKDFIKLPVSIRAVHPTALESANEIIDYVLRREEFSKS